MPRPARVTRNLYVRPGDEVIWDAAERIAKFRHMSLSTLVISLLQMEVQRVRANPELTFLDALPEPTEPPKPKDPLDFLTE